MGLVSNGGVHSSLEHLLKLNDIAKEYGIHKAYVHCFMQQILCKGRFYITKAQTEYS